MADAADRMIALAEARLEVVGRLGLVAACPGDFAAAAEAARPGSDRGGS